MEPKISGRFAGSFTTFSGQYYAPSAICCTVFESPEQYATHAKYSRNLATLSYSTIQFYSQLLMVNYKFAARNTVSTFSNSSFEQYLES